MQKSKGQGAMDYLLIVGGAVAIAAIIVFLVVSSPSKESAAEGARRTEIATECTNTCADLKDCTAYSTVKACVEECKLLANEEPAITSTACNFDCKENTPAHPTGELWVYAGTTNVCG